MVEFARQVASRHLRHVVAVVLACAVIGAVTPGVAGADAIADKRAQVTSDAEAESTAEQTAAALREAGARTARATTGESEPLQALEDALATYRADRILVFVRPEDRARYREEDVLGEAERRFGLPVSEVARP